MNGPAIKNDHRELLLCRHGETDTNAQGNTHIPGGEVQLNEVGQRQAAQLAAVAAAHDVQAIFASPEKRAIETAQIVGHSLTIEPIIIGDLKERDWGDWNGEPWSTIEAKLMHKTLNERYTFLPPHGESWEQMDQRLKEAVDTIMSKAKGNVMIVTHGGALRALVPRLKHEELIRSLSYNFHNASVTSFSFSPPETYTLLTENDTTHLRSES
jgi:broad specificity phosphatase PhoE